MANVCLCGCGEFLPEGSTRQYKRGHKAKAESPDIAIESSPETVEESAPESFTIEDAARETPDDPEPREQEYKPKTTVKITAAIRRDIEGKLALGFGMLGETWSIIDPLCGQTLVEHGPNMAKKYTPLLCQSPEVVKWMTKSGNFLLWVDALMATWPVIQIAAAHHVMHTVSVEMMRAGANGQGEPMPNEYVVQ